MHTVTLCENQLPNGQCKSNTNILPMIGTTLLCIVMRVRPRTLPIGSSYQRPFITACLPNRTASSYKSVLMQYEEGLPSWKRSIRAVAAVVLSSSLVMVMDNSNQLLEANARTTALSDRRNLLVQQRRQQS